MSYPCGFELHDYQKKGADFLVANSHALLADEMGLGKTAQTITALDRVLAMRCLIICPAVAKFNWAKEFKMWSNLKRNIAIKRSLSDPIHAGETVICTFDYAATNYEELNKENFDAVIIDEAHFLKNTGAKRTQAILGAKGIAHNSKRMWLLTGTPAPNHAGELWVYLYTFGATKLRQEDFIKRYCNVQIRRYPGVPPQLKVLGAKKEMIPELKTLIKKISIRRLKKDVMPTLPKLNWTTRYLDCDALTIDDLEIHKDFCEDIVMGRKQILIDKIRKQDNLMHEIWDTCEDARKGTAPKFLDIMQTMQKTLPEIRKYTGLQKAKHIPAEIVHFMESDAGAATYHLNPVGNRKLVIFCVHRCVIEELLYHDDLQKYGIRAIYGGTAESRRNRFIEQFQRDNSKVNILLCNIQAAGTAINLTKANHLWFVEMDWVPGNNAQAVMRVHRLGQTKDVQVRVYSSGKTLDAQIQKILRTKTRELTDIFDT